ncbi:tRNA adenosine(34) deaminase TadA [Halopseudomonas salina]|uniref:tRNA-specific adenosine deaminase n=1 Tax=Halopseudomonas salina TaxID=1323744 RepID=A0ABQ1Q245_9GAMM|nr:tRNA adenosine(34) deaminase TadA [Halopseudomonas salina]GGD10678.1 tRNA-specific adenosine deaminase [Halopseudomonas salina]
MKPADIDFMRLALAEAHLAAELGEVPVGAVLVHQGRVIGKGFNQPISSNDPSAHAEMVALRQAALAQSNYRLPDTTLYVTLEPCTMCAGLLIHSRVSRLVFGASEPRAGAVISRAQIFDQPWMNHRIEVEGGVLAEECGEVLRAFFKGRR